MDLSAQEGTVAPGNTFSYSVTYRNLRENVLSGAQLNLAIPLGASLVSADGGGVLDTDQAVRWPLEVLASGVQGRFTVFRFVKKMSFTVRFGISNLR